MYILAHWHFCGNVLLSRAMGPTLLVIISMDKLDGISVSEQVKSQSKGKPVTKESMTCHLASYHYHVNDITNHFHNNRYTSRYHVEHDKWSYLLQYAEESSLLTN